MKKVKYLLNVFGLKKMLLKYVKEDKGVFGDSLLSCDLSLCYLFYLHFLARFEHGKQRTQAKH